jgi:hypothetical protein
MSTTNPLVEPDPYAVALDDVAALDQQIAKLSAVRARRVTEAARQLHRQTPTDTSTAGPRWSPARVERIELLTEIALFTHRTEYRTATLVDTSTALVDRLPSTLDALSSGRLSWEHAEVIAKHADGLDGDALVTYDTRLAVLAASVNPKQLEKKARHEVELAQPTTAVQRAEKAAATRRLYVEPAADGMANLTLFAPAPEIHAIADRAIHLAAGLKQAGDPRSMGHLKVDVLTDLLLNGETSIPGATRGIRGRVHVMVPAMTLLGIGDEAAILRGYGPIDPATAAMADHARLVHPECVFPGCTVPSEQADIDHTEDHAHGGDTVPENLAPLSPNHHRVKHHTRWVIIQNGDDTLTATSPAGHVYTIHPEGKMRPAPTQLLKATQAAAEAARPAEEDLADCPF